MLLVGYAIHEGHGCDFNMKHRDRFPSNSKRVDRRQANFISRGGVYNLNLGESLVDVAMLVDYQQTRHQRRQRTPWTGLSGHLYMGLIASSVLVGWYCYYKHGRNPYGPRVFAGIALSQLPREYGRYGTLSLSLKSLEEGLRAMNTAFRALAKDVWKGKLLISSWTVLQYLKVLPPESTPST